MLSIRNLSKTFINGKTAFQALNNVSVDIHEGEIFGFIGLSGAGKTSLARCISMLELPDSGEIILDGSDIVKLKGAELRNARKKLGLVFQHFHLLMNSTVYENIAFPLELEKRSKTVIDKKVTELLELTGLTDKKNSYPSKLSGGQKQRVGIARALAAEPEIVICDEATSALDPNTTWSILELIKGINKNLGVTFIMITHEMDVIKQLCHRVAVMENGEIIEQSNVIDMLASPKTTTAKRFFKEVNNGFDLSRHSMNISRGEKIIKATFVGDSALQPFISDIIRKFDVELSILSGNIESVGDTMIGSLIMKISGSDSALESSIQYFRDGKIETEVIFGA